MVRLIIKQFSFSSPRWPYMVLILAVFLLLFPSIYFLLCHLFDLALQMLFGFEQSRLDLIYAASVTFILCQGASGRGRELYREKKLTWENWKAFLFKEELFLSLLWGLSVGFVGGVGCYLVGTALSFTDILLFIALFPLMIPLGCLTSIWHAAWIVKRREQKKTS